MPIPKRILCGLPVLSRLLDARAARRQSGLPLPGTIGRSLPAPAGLPAGPRLPLGLAPGLGAAMPSTLAGGSTPGGGGQPGGGDPDNPADPHSPAYPEAPVPQWQSCCPASGRHASAAEPGDGFAWAFLPLSGAAAVPVAAYSNLALRQSSAGGDYDCWQEHCGRWEWTSALELPPPPAPAQLSQGLLLLGRPLRRVTGASLHCELELRLNAVARFASIALWLSDRNGGESARVELLADCADGLWAVHSSTHSLSGLASSGLSLNLEAVGSSEPAALGLTRLYLAALHLRCA